jgi:hypothetical protein
VKPRIPLIPNPSSGGRTSQKKTKPRIELAKAVTPWRLFGPPPILEGEDAAAFDELFGRVCAAIKPVDVIDEMFIADVVASEWEFLRWSRLKLNLIRGRALKALEDFLGPRLDSRLCREHFTYELTTFLQQNLAEDQADDFTQTLAQKCARNKPDAVDKINDLLAGIDPNINTDSVLHWAKASKARELVLEYVRREPDAVEFIDKHLATASVSIETLTAKTLAEELDYIERIDRLATIAESRRNASLHEIDRRRPILGEKLRRSVQEAEDAEFEVIEATPAKEKMLLDERPQD